MIIKGMKIHILIFSKNTREANNHHMAKAQLSHINILAGNTLKNINAAKTAITMATNVLAI